MAVRRLPSPPGCSPKIDNWCFSQIKVREVQYTWTIENFSFYLGEEMRDIITSSIFPAGPNDPLKWRLRVQLNSIDVKTKDNLSLYLILVRGPNCEVSTKFKFSLLNDGLEPKHSMRSLTIYKFFPGEQYGFKNFIGRSYLFDQKDELLPNDKLKILCEISIIPNNINFSGRCKVIKRKIPECRLQEDFNTLFETQKFSDVTLLVGDRKFQGHKHILATRCSVFAAMFEDEMVERVSITDVDYEVLIEILRFIYTGKAANLDQMAEAVLPAAGKYALGRLKVLCEVALLQNLTVDNACETLILADLHNAEQLRSQTLEYIIHLKR